LNNLLFSVLVGTGAGIIGTGLGGAIAFLLNNPGKRFLSTLLSFSSGLMIAVTCFDLMPNAISIGSLFHGLTGIVAGTVMIIICQELIFRTDRKKRSGQVLGVRSKNYLRTGILMGIGIALHNFPEGLAIGSGFTAVESYGIGLSLVIAMHDIPEGIAMATPMRMGGMKKPLVFLSALLAGVPTGIGALIGYLLGEISPYFISLCLGFAGGAMLYITCNELIPESNDLHRGRISSVGLVCGVIAGIWISSII
jgi:ZIP family zinc transporter